jgi:CBS domain-containing protein
MVDDSDTPAGSEYSKRLFEVLSVIPADQRLVTVPPDTQVADAIAVLDKHGFSQLPVVNDGGVLGVFSYRSYARAVLAQTRKASANKPFNPLSLTVGDCMAESPRFARVTDLFTHWFDDLDRYDSLLVGDVDRLQAIVSAHDVVRYLYRVASPYVLVADCEFSLRAIIHLLVSDDMLTDCARQCLTEKYPADKIPVGLSDMTLDDYVRIVTDGRWSHFEPAFGRNRDYLRSRLDKLREVRNQLFHHRADVTPEEHESLAADRAWLQAKVKIVEGHQRPEGMK